MQFKFWKALNLQLFGEGAGAAPGGDGAGTGVGAESAAADAGQDNTLENLGVPPAKAEKYRAKYGSRSVQQKQQVPQEQDAAAKADYDEETPKKNFGDALRENPEWNREMQGIIQGRLKNTNARLDSALQILEMIGGDYGITAQNASELDLDALRNAIENDTKRYRKMANDLGVEPEVARDIDKTNRENKRLKEEKKQEQQNIEFQRHYGELQRQAVELGKEVPGFNLDTAMQDKKFFFLTRPEVGFTVREAWLATHGDEMLKQRESRAVQSSRQAMANSIRSGRGMPLENGTVQRAAASPVTETPYSQMDKASRAEFVRQLKAGRKF